MDNKKIEALISGDEKVFEELFIAYFSKVRVFINGIIKSEDDAEELAQDIFVKIWTTKENIDSNKSISSFIYVMARNAAFNYLKHKVVERNYMESFDTTDYIVTPEENFFATEKALLLEMHINKMPIQRKKIYKLSREEDMNNGEIAEMLGVSKKTVENQLSLALKDLRNAVNLFNTFFL